MTTNKTPLEIRPRKLKHAALTSRDASRKIGAARVTRARPSLSRDKTTHGSRRRVGS